MMISISNLVKQFKDRTVIDNLSLDIEQEVFSFLGPNGAGKTTIVNILCGFLKRDSGEVTIAGLDPNNAITAIRRKIGLVPQETALYEYLTAKENLEFHARFYGVPRDQRKQKITEALELAQLEDRAADYVSTFSGGMKRRLALVRALLHDPEILILDEPSLGIDVQSRNEIWKRIRSLKDDYKKTILLTSNYMDEADRLSDRCAILDQGKLVALDTPANLKLRYAGGIRVEAKLILPDSDVEMLHARLHEIAPETRIEKQTHDNAYYIVMPAKAQANQLLTEVSQVFQELSSITLQDLSLRVPTLDDVFLEITGSTLRDNEG